MQAWHKQLTQLTEGPYVGYGGKRLLAAELGVFESTIYKWLCASVQPSTRHAQAIKALWPIAIPFGVGASLLSAAYFFTHP